MVQVEKEVVNANMTSEGTRDNIAAFFDVVSIFGFIYLLYTLFVNPLVIESAIHQIYVEARTVKILLVIILFQLAKMGVKIK